MTEYILGADTSRWQSKMDWTVAKSRGVQFAIIKASEYTKDIQYDNSLEGLIRNGLSFGVYHYFHPGGNIQQQIDLFSSLVTGDIIPFADIECRDGLTYVASQVRQFVEGIENKTGLTCGIYTSSGFWNYRVGKVDWAEEHPLWVANYTNLPQPSIPNSWTQWTYWQYSCTGNGKYYGANSRYIDLNRKNEYSIPPINKDKYAYVLYTDLRKRIAPNTKAKVVGARIQGTEYKVINEYKDSNGIWYKDEENNWSAKLYLGIPYLEDRYR